MDTRVIIQTSIPISSVTLTMANSSEEAQKQRDQSMERQPSLDNPVKQLARKSFQHLSLTDSRDGTPLGSPGHQKIARPFRFSSLRRKRHSQSIETGSPPSSQAQQNEAYITAFQRELQNLPPPDISPVPHLPTAGISSYSSSIATYIKEALERSAMPSFIRPRSCSVPRVGYESYNPNSLQLPTNQKPLSVHNSPMTRSPTAEGTAINVTSFGERSGSSGTSTDPSSRITAQSPSKSPSKLAPKPPQPLTESPISCSTYRSASRSGSRSGSAGQVLVEPIMPNTHRAILKLIHDWARLCPNDLRHSKMIAREIRDFLNRVSLLGENYRYFADEIKELTRMEVGLGSCSGVGNGLRRWIPSFFAKIPNIP